MPPPLPPHEAPLPEEEPDAKRPRTDTFVLQAEEEFADERPGVAQARACRLRGPACRLRGPPCCLRGLACCLRGPAACLCAGPRSACLPERSPLPRLPRAPAPRRLAPQVRVQCPSVEGQESLKGQLLEVEMPSLLSTVGELKARLAEALGLAPGRQQLSREHVGLLKNELSLAFYNVGPGITLALALKERGGRKK